MPGEARTRHGGGVPPRNAPARSTDICVVGVGASAGGLEACKRLLAALPAAPGMAFILVQHLEPSHESLLAGLLAKATDMPVLQAADGMVVEVDHFYVIPPGAYLAFSSGVLHLSAPPPPGRVRLPFDFLLESMASELGPRAVCVLLSGTGTDGTTGLRAIKAAGGFVLAQAPADASFSGMPESAIATGEVDDILPVEEIAARLLHLRGPPAGPAAPAGPAEIIALLKAKTPHDFTLYKSGTMERRILNRMSILGMAPADTQAYFDLLERDAQERENLVNDLLINVTSFFRDPKVFEALSALVLPGLVSAAESAIRIWVAGCSTGEETYSLAMLFHEHLTAAKSPAKLQIFASDADAKAVAIAREGFYLENAVEKISPRRLAEFFIRQEHGYRVSTKLRADIVFAVQDVLADPPFSKMDFISCRNLLIYLRPPAQARALSIFNFSLRQGGVLLLGRAENVPISDTRFEVISKPDRMYRKTGVSSADDVLFQVHGSELLRKLVPANTRQVPLDIAELHKRVMLENHAPAAVLVNERFEYLYSSGATQHYLRVTQGYPSADFLTMLLPVTNRHEQLYLVCFTDQPAAMPRGRQGSVQGKRRQGELEAELREVRAELEAMTRSLEDANQEQNAINEEALSVNEEFQSANEELVTSKEELQSLNEELIVLNTQLQETLELSRTTSNDLQNMLYSSDLATVFLDIDLKIRFFTPAFSTLFTVIAGDIGRPLSDLRSLAGDPTLLEEAREVLDTLEPVERDIEAGDMWFKRRILPYRKQDHVVAGVVITFTDITLAVRTSQALEAADLEARRADRLKTRFMAAASHDLRQPLQTLALLAGLQANKAHDDEAKKLCRKMEETTSAMGGILNTLLDINQIDAGQLKPEPKVFLIHDLLGGLHEEFFYTAEANGLQLRVVPCSLMVRTDPGILEQMLRNLISNALKYTERGRILLGCRRAGDRVRIEVWDTGIGIERQEVALIFQEYHQVGNEARDRGKGVGLGLSIVQRLAEMLEHRVAVRSNRGRGSVFSVEVPLASPAEAPPHAPKSASSGKIFTGQVLIIEDDADIRNLMTQFLSDEGHRVSAANTGAEAVKMVAGGGVRPQVVIVDYNLPDEANGLDVVAQLRNMNIPPFGVIVCTGDISAQAVKAIAAANCHYIGKPMRLKVMNDTIQRLLARGPEPEPEPAPPRRPARASISSMTMP